MSLIPPTPVNEVGQAPLERTSAERLVHDLNNALMVAMGSLSMIQCNTTPGSATTPYVSMLEQALRRMSERVAAFEREGTAPAPQ